jgi:hypothetical protein
MTKNIKGADNEILFGERSRALKFDIDAMISLEAAMDGKSTGDIVGSLANWNFTALVLALWAGLKHEDPKLKPASVQKMLTRYVNLPGANLRQLRDAVREAIESSAWYKQAISTDDDAPAADDTEADEGNV